MPEANREVIELAILKFDGEDISQLVAFSPKTAKWYPFDLKQPIKKSAVPFVAYSIATFVFDHRVAAFSSVAGRWELLELPEGATPRLRANPGLIAVEFEEHLYVFSGETGKWSDFNRGIRDYHDQRRQSSHRTKGLSPQRLGNRVKNRR